MSPTLKQARECLGRRDLAGAFDALARFWADSPNGKGHQLLAEVCLQAQAFERADVHAQRFAVAAPDPAALQELAGMFAERGLLKTAAVLLSGAVTARESAGAWNDLGVVQWGMRRREDAISSLEHAVNLEPSHAEAAENLAFIRASSEPIRILALSDARSPHTQRFATYFAGLGYEVHLLSDTWVDLPGITVHAPETPIPVLNLSTWVELLQRLLRDLRPALVHGHYASIYGLWGALCGFHPYVLTLWGSDINVDPHLGANYHTLVQFALSQADVIIGQSNDLNLKARELSSAPIVEPVRLTFGIDTRKFRPDLDASALRDRLSLGNGPVILSPRQFKSAANIHRILEGVPAVLERYPDAIFILNTVLTGSDEYTLKLQAMIDALGIRSSVLVLSDVPYDEMPGLYNLAAMTLSVRDADGASNTVMESLACLTPVIASDLPSNHELMGPHAGLFVDPHEPGELARAMLELLDDPARAAEMGRRGRERITEHHDHARNMTRMNELYVRALEQRLWEQSDVKTWQERAIELSQSEHPQEAMAALAIAQRLARTPWERAQASLTSSLLLPPSHGEGAQAFQAALADILRAAERID